MLKLEEAIGSGIDYVSDSNPDPDDTFRLRILGDRYARVLLDPHGTIKTGDGTTPPTAISASVGGIVARPTYDVRDHGVYPDGDARFVSAAFNTFFFNLFEGSIAGSADFMLIAGTWSFTGIAITKSGHRIIGAGGKAALVGVAGTGTVINHNNGTTPALTIAGSDSPGTYGNRLLGTGVEGVMFDNHGPTTIGLKCKHVTLAYFDDVAFQGFRAEGGGLYAYNFADSVFFNCSWDFCGSADQTDKAVIYLNPPPDGVETPKWGADAIHFISCRWENNSDKLVKFRQGSGFQVNKVFFTDCKFENSVSGVGTGLGGSNSTTQAQYDMDTASMIVFNSCDFTLQNLDSSIAYVLPTIFRLRNACGVYLSNCQFSFGAGAFPKCFTNFFVADSNLTWLSLTNVWINSGNAGAFPTLVLKATNTPLLTMRGVGFTPFQGSGKVLADFFTAAEWKGVHAGAPATGGVIA